ncbi:sensor histidine kinase [Fodinibius sp. Rm-B-1B1-1]|uniref:sensor histidine kinase n=1 Tax=Fodinibius alkaliphilus TaxID=3140241 RepID=UPI003159A1CD
MLIILLLGPTGFSIAQTAPDSTWSFPTVLLDTDNDDTLDYADQHIRIGGIANTAFSQIHTTRLSSAIQNDNYGLRFYSKMRGDSFEVGDSLVLEGRLHNYNGLNELYVDSYEVYPEVNKTFSPKTLTDKTNNPDRFIGMLVEGSGKITDKGTINNGIYLSVSMRENNEFEPKVFLSNFHNSFTDFNFDILSIGDKISFTGVLSEFKSDLAGHNYLVYLRTPDDLQYTGIPRYYFYGAGGLILLIFTGVIVWIISLRRKVESKTQKVQKSLEEKEILLREIHHRVKNNLSIISGLLDLQKDTTDVESTHNALQDSQSRIRSMALIHDKLYQTESLSDINLDEYLEELVEAISATFINKQNKVDVKYELDEANINIDKVVPCGLLVNELVVNAFKHAFDDKKQGVLTVKLQNQGQEAVLTVADNGPGLPENFNLDTGDSLGSMLIQTFAAQLGAELTIDRDYKGAAFIFTFSLN